MTTTSASASAHPIFKGVGDTSCAPEVPADSISNAFEKGTYSGHYILSLNAMRALKDKESTKEELKAMRRAYVALRLNAPRYLVRKIQTPTSSRFYISIEGVRLIVSTTDSACEVEYIAPENFTENDPDNDPSPGALSPAILRKERTLYRRVRPYKELGYFVRCLKGALFVVVTTAFFVLAGVKSISAKPLTYFENASPVRFGSVRSGA